MDEITFGEVIRSIRKAKGMTQEEVAEGICSTSSLSKMENGSQVPSRQRFQKIMERLGEPGYSYAHFFSSGEAEREQYRREALEALEGGRVERAEELLLWWKKDADSEEDVMERQFWQTAELLWRRIYEAPGPGYRERCMELFSMTRSSFCLQKEWREDNFTRTETLLLNNAGLGFLWEKRYREAAGVFLQLYSINERTGKKRSDYRKKKAVLCGNLAVCFGEMGRLSDAARYYARGTGCVREQGGVVLYLQLLRIGMGLADRAGEEEEAFRERELIRRIVTDLWGRGEAGQRLSFFLRQPPGISIL